MNSLYKLYEKDSDLFEVLDAVEPFDFKELSNGPVNVFWSYIRDLAKANTKGTLFDALFVNAIYDDLRGENKVKKKFNNKLYHSIDNNLWNFSVAKSFKLISSLNKIKEGEPELVNQRINSLSKLMFIDQQKVERKQVDRTTETAVVASSGGYLQYVSENDSKCRPQHKAANGTKLPANDPWWTKVGAKLLSEYNCRCNIVQIKKTRPVRPENEIKVDDEHIPSKIDIKNGTVDVFNEDLPIFEGTSVLRKYYKGKQGAFD
jgi:hypothetical protein